MLDKIAAWGKRPFQFTLYACVQFIFLTFVAMLTYRGGTHSDPSSQGYSFSHNFLSSLGLTRAPNGEPNMVSAILFFIAMASAGLGLALYFAVVPQFFWYRRLTRLLSLAGSLFGVICGVSFMGIAFTPADILPRLHTQFFLLAYRTLLVAVVFYLLAIYLNREYPNRYASFYLFLAVLLGVYSYLISWGRT
jgi:hypothetical protein